MQKTKKNFKVNGAFTTVIYMSIVLTSEEVEILRHRTAKMQRKYFRSEQDYEPSASYLPAGGDNAYAYIRYQETGIMEDY